MKNRAKPSPAAGDFLFEIDSEPLDECVTALGGVPRLARAIRSLDVPGSLLTWLRDEKRPGEPRYTRSISFEALFLPVSRIFAARGCSLEPPCGGQTLSVRFTRRNRL
jgi:hypothetical protein